MSADMKLEDNTQQFITWWTTQARHTAIATARKCAEYGSEDLFGIGHDLADLAGDQVDDETAFELGCLFYIIGKLERAKSAAKNGRPASDDTWLDLAVYSTMILAKRAGVWFEQQPQLNEGNQP